jgi:hypothetical protein
MNEGTRSGKSTIRLLGISAERPTNGLYLLPLWIFLVLPVRDFDANKTVYLVTVKMSTR